MSVVYLTVFLRQDDWHSTTYHLPGKRKMSPFVEDPTTLFISWPSTIANVLYEKYKNQGFEILAFPCNQFAGQEPGSNEEIQDTIDANGKNTAPVYKF
ncbi:hypothetical protein NC651_036397 [Populus alba x Populus x berolinensis]|nr:hypothetical protein NC651_036397 [Populus alba x Populus x berolinensis]